MQRAITVNSVLRGDANGEIFGSGSAWHTDLVTTRDSRTTKKARVIAPEARITVAVPAVLVESDGEPQGASLGKSLGGLFSRSFGGDGNPAARVLAFGRAGTVVLSTKPSNGAIPSAVVADTPSLPELLEQDQDGLVVQLDAETYRVGRIHTDTMLTAMETATQVAESDVDDESTISEPQAPVEFDVEDEAVEQTGSEMHDPEPDHRPELEPEIEVVNEDAARVVDERVADERVGDLAVASDEATSRVDGAKAAASAKASSWGESLKRNLLTDEFGDIEIETRSRPTMQCQRLLPDRYVYLAVPGKAEPRENSEDPKGKFVIAFTDEGVMLFKPSRGNEALPRDVIGAIDSKPIRFEAAGYNDREGGCLTVGGRRYVITRPYVRSLTAHIAEHGGDAAN